jgi:Flp pilus assembly protein TadD
MRGKESKAMEWYRQALAVKPADNDAMRQMGVSHSKLGEERQALDWYRRAIECCEQDYDAMRQMGISFAMLGDYGAATTWIQLALTVNPADLESKRNLKLVQRKQSGSDDAFGGALMTKVARGITLAWRRFINRLG